MFGNTKFLIGVAVVLIIIAAGLGVAIIRSNTDKELTSLTGESESKSTPKPTANLADFQVKALEVPGNNAKPEDLAKYGDLVAQSAEESTEVNLDSCVPTPPILKGKLGSIVTFRNLTDQETQFATDPDHINIIPAKGQIEVKLDFGKGPGIYGYSCNGSSKSVGVIYITS